MKLNSFQLVTVLKAEKQAEKKIQAGPRNEKGSKQSPQLQRV